jgi:hypothetical protein
MDLVESESASEHEDQRSISDPLSPPFNDAGNAHPNSDCGIGHRVLASRSVLALAVDENCVFAGLQGGDIVVSRFSLGHYLIISCFLRSVLHCQDSWLMISTGVVPRNI